MVEVFKTNITEAAIARRLVKLIREQFGNYDANFDLDDCDRILRIKSSAGFVDSWSLINFLEQMGYQAELLADDFP